MKVLLWAAVFSVAVASAIPTPRVVCYYTNWSVFGESQFKIEGIDPQLCTHIVYSFIGCDQNGNVKSLDPWNDFGDEWTEGGFKKFVKLKKVNPSVKLLLGLGGWNEGHLNLQSVVRNPEKRKTFLRSSMSMVRRHGFDGLEIDWIFQVNAGTPEDKIGFSELVREMKPEYEEAGLLLSAATSANPTLFDSVYDIQRLTETLDFVNIMSYDLHGSWDRKTGHVSPLYPMRTESESERWANVESVVARYIEKGAIPEKLNLGLVGYGRTFTLIDKSNTGLNSPASGPGKIEPLPFLKFCSLDKNNYWKKFENKEQAIPYAVAEEFWVGYEDTESLTQKVKFLKSKKLGGASFWSLDTDDFNGICDFKGLGKYPLLKTIKAEIAKN